MILGRIIVFQIFIDNHLLLAAQKGGLSGLVDHLLGLLLVADAFLLNFLLQLLIECSKSLIGQEYPQHEDDEVHTDHAIEAH